MKVKTADLTGAALDWAVGECLRPTLKTPEHLGISTFGPLFGKGYKYPSWCGKKFSPSSDWKHGGPIIERERIRPVFRDLGPDSYWFAEAFEAYQDNMYISGKGSTLLVAVMRCYVASRLGNEVEIPDILLATKV